LLAFRVLKRFIDAKPLLRKLLFLMDNYMKDNKNHHLLAFLSLLTTRKLTFKEVQLKFIVVGHTTRT
jgi:hypothetical protein